MGLKKSMNGSDATYKPKDREALYVTTFPHQQYRRPFLAAQALKLLNIRTMLLSGWETISHYQPISKLVKASSYLPPPLNWLVKATAYETGLLAAVRSIKPYLFINLNIIGAPALRRIAPDGYLILDIQDFSIQDDHTIPHYDLQTIKNSHPDLLIFASRAIMELIERRYPKLVKQAKHIPFGIDLKVFDEHYSQVSPKYFREYLGLPDSPLLVYSGAAYLWGEREGQGLGLMLETVKIVRQSFPKVRLIIQGAAAPGTRVYLWIASRVTRLGLSDCCILLPATSPYDTLRMSMLKASDVLLLPIGDVLGTYYSEQQKLYEYMAAARPIAMVSTPARLNVIGKEEAYISEREPEDFAAQIIRALTDRDEALAKARKARRLVEEKYDWKYLAPLYARAVGEVVGTPLEPQPTNR